MAEPTRVVNLANSQGPTHSGGSSARIVELEHLLSSSAIQFGAELAAKEREIDSEKQKAMSYVQVHSTHSPPCNLDTPMLGTYSPEWQRGSTFGTRTSLPLGSGLSFMRARLVI